MSKIKPKQVMYLTVVAAVLSIVVSMITLTGELAVLNTDAVIFFSPTLGSTHENGSEIKVTVVFSPALTGVDAPQATGYYIMVKMGETILFQEESTGVLYTTSFTKTRYFSSSEVGTVIITATMTVSGTDYYNEVFITIVSYVEVPEEPTTTTEASTPSFEFTIIFITLIIMLLNKKRCLKNDK